MLQARAGGGVDVVVMTISDFTLAWRVDPASRPDVLVGEASRAAWGVRKQDSKLKFELDAYIDNLRSGASSTSSSSLPSGSSAARPQAQVARRCAGLSPLWVVIHQPGRTRPAGRLT
jgi:hypothetical protein